VRAQKADSENVSGSDADAGSSRSQSADMRPQVRLRPARIRQVKR
jgi:hypothetical protein